VIHKKLPLAIVVEKTDVKDLRQVLLTFYSPPHFHFTIIGAQHDLCQQLTVYNFGSAYIASTLLWLSPNKYAS